MAERLRAREVPVRVAEPFVDVEDIADLAVAALTEDGHAGRVYALTAEDVSPGTVALLRYLFADYAREAAAAGAWS